MKAVIILITAAVLAWGPTAFGPSDSGIMGSEKEIHTAFDQAFGAD